MTIKQIINTPNRIPPHTFVSEHKNEYSRIIIYEENKKYGILNGNGEIVLPFHYDNITVIGFGLLLLVQNGKFGMLHIKRDYYKPNEQFEIAKIIPCEYDRIASPYHEEIVILEKDVKCGIEVNLYFTNTEEITKSYCGYNLLSRDIIEVKSDNERHIYDARTGDIFFSSNNNRFALCDFEVKGGTTKEYNEHNFTNYDLIIYDVHLRKNTISLIYYNGEGIKEFVFDGEPHMIFDFKCYEGDSLSVRNIIVKKENEIYILDNKCNVISCFPEENLSINNLLECKSNNKTNSNIVCQSLNYMQGKTFR